MVLCRLAVDSVPRRGRGVSALVGYARRAALVRTPRFQGGRRLVTSATGSSESAVGCGRRIARSVVSANAQMRASNLRRARG